jgi:hypothetical protein
MVSNVDSQILLASTAEESTTGMATNYLVLTEKYTTFSALTAQVDG